MKSALCLLVLLTFLKCFYMLNTFDPTKHPNWHLLHHGSECGVSISDRIIGGEDASLGQYPWIARIQIRMRKEDEYSELGSFFHCGGAIINSMYILTAAHCVPKNKSIYIDAVRLGEHNVNTDPDCAQSFCAPPVQDIRVTKVIEHNYNIPHRFKNDICLLRLEKPIQFNEFVAPICMVYGKLMNYNHANQIMDVAGWGLTDIVTLERSEILKTLKVPILSDSDCKNQFKGLAKIGDDQLCGGGIIGKDSCVGDSGGPLMRVFDIDGLSRYFLFGIVSFGKDECAESKLPGVYTRVSYFMEWILDNIKP